MTASQTTPQSRFVEANGMRLHYKEWSTQGPPLILLHGATSSSNSWDAIAPSFVDDYRVMAFDLRGHGQSDKPESGYSIESDYARDISAFITEQLDEPAIVIGHSTGALISPAVAVQAGEAVRAIVMEDPPVFLTEGALYTRAAFALTVKALPFDQRVERLMKPTSMPHEVAITLAENYGNMSESVVTELAKGGTIYRPEDVLPNVSCSTLVILGNPTIDAVVEWSDRTRLRRLLKGSRILDWPEVGHNIHRDAPERFVTAVSDFLQTLS